jgi:hypothetical protein
MEVTVGCGTAGVSVVDDQSAQVVEFTNVPVLGGSSICGNSDAEGFGADFKSDPGGDFRSKD